MHFVVHVIAGRATRSTDVAEDVTALDSLAGLDADLGEVAVAS